MEISSDVVKFLAELAVCFLLSFSIGVERQFRRKLIGLRTTILVCVGSFLFVYVSGIVSSERTDLTRIAAGVVSGISFLGAGVIIKDGSKVKGLTTAATLWCVSAIGVLCGVGALYEATIGTAVILFINIILRNVNSRINKATDNMHTLEEYDLNIVVNKKDVVKVKEIIDHFISNNNKWELSINAVVVTEDKDGSLMKINLEILKSYDKNLSKIISEIYAKVNVKSMDYQKVKDLREDEEDEF